MKDNKYLTCVETAMKKARSADLFGIKKYGFLNSYFFEILWKNGHSHL